MARPTQRIPTHPGEFFRLDVLPHLKLEGEPMTLAGVARAIGLSKQYFHLVAQGKTPMTAEVAVRLTKLTGGNPRMWLNMQAAHDLAQAERKLARHLAKIPAADRIARAVAGRHARHRNKSDRGTQKSPLSDSSLSRNRERALSCSGERTAYPRSLRRLYRPAAGIR